MATYNASEIIGKGLFAKVPIIVYASPNGKKLYTVEAGERVGTVFSYVVRNSTIWWQLEENKTAAFVKQHTGFYDVKAIQEQGAKTEEQKQKEKEDENKTTIEKSMDFLKKYLPWIGGGIVGFIVLKSVLENRKK